MLHISRMFFVFGNLGRSQVSQVNDLSIGEDLIDQEVGVSDSLSWRLDGARRMHLAAALAHQKSQAHLDGRRQLCRS